MGLTWRDNTLAGIRPRLEITELEPFRRFAESGRWRGVHATLEMRFTATGQGCRVTVLGEVSGSGPWSVPARAAGRIAGRAIRHDLHRAGEILTRRPR